MIIRLLSILFFCLLLNSILKAQNINETDIKQQFPNAEAVFTNQSEQVNITFENDKWGIVRTINEETYYLKNVGQKYATSSIYYSGFDKIDNIKAQTLVPTTKKGKFKTFEVNNINTKDVLQGSIFYSDHQEKEFTFPAVQAGAITQLSYTESTNEPYLLSGFTFGAHLPILNAEFSLTFPNNIEILHKIMGKSTNNIAFSQTTKNNKTTYTWKAKNLNEIKPEENIPSYMFFVPHIIVHIAKVKKNDGTVINILSNPKDLYTWYSSLTKHINETNNTTLKQIVAEITQNTKNEEEKIKAIYSWVQNNVKYIAFEDGLGGFVPRNAVDVCQKKYGDCKDMSNILVEMLKIAGIDAYLTWIGTRKIPYSYQEVPAPMSDNHMICAVKQNNNFIFLDATGSYLPLGLPSSMIQGKEALVGLDSLEYQIVKIPEVPANQNTFIEKSALNIDENGNLNGKTTIELNGYVKTFAEYDRLKIENNGTKQQFFNTYFRRGSNKFEAKNVNDNGFYKPYSPIFISLDCSIPDYVKKTNDKYYLNLNLNKRYSDNSIKIEERKCPFYEFEYKFVEDYTITLQIPDTYTIDYLPKNITFANPLFNFEINYTLEKNTIIYSKKLTLNTLLLNNTDFDAWNNFVNQLNTAYKEAIVLKK